VRLPGRGPGEMALVEFGDPDRPVDLIFLHANGFNALTYRAILEPLAAEAHVLAVDMRGHGRTTLETPIEGRRSWMDLRDDLLALLESLETVDVVLGGHSMGGAVSIFAAADAPHRVRSLVLFDPVIIPRRDLLTAAETPSTLVAGALRRRAIFPSTEIVLETYQGRTAFKTWSSEMLRDYVADGFLALPNGEVTLACRPQWESSNFAAQDQDVWGAVARTRCPVTILRAEIESTCRIDAAAEALMADPRISMETISGAGHFLPMERPELCLGVLASALQT
jgi:pimeloyl-ACP methyl ester carboxylesterase